MAVTKNPGLGEWLDHYEAIPDVISCDIDLKISLNFALFVLSAGNN
jgi:hypothetical protein